MASYKWADVASSESCASFGRTTMMLLERRERYNNLYRNYNEPSRATKFDKLHANSKSSHFMLMSNDSYMDKNSVPELHDSKHNLNMKLKNVQLKPLSKDEGELLVDDEILTPLLNTNEDHIDDDNPKSFANFLTPTNEDKSKGKSSSFKSKQASGSSKAKPSVTFERLSPTNSSPSNLNKKTSEEPKNVVDKKQNEVNTVPVANEKRSINCVTSNYYDDETNKLLNPTKKFKDGLRMTQTEKAEISKVLLSELTKGNKAQAVEDVNTRVYSRLKDIAIGKATKGYQNYIRMIPKDERGPDDPQTPDSKNVSASKFRAIYRDWRTRLHKYDNVN